MSTRVEELVLAPTEADLDIVRRRLVGAGIRAGTGAVMGSECINIWTSEIVVGSSTFYSDASRIFRTGDEYRVRFHRFGTWIADYPGTLDEVLDLVLRVYSRAGRDGTDAPAAFFAEVPDAEKYIIVRADARRLVPPADA